MPDPRRTFGPVVLLGVGSSALAAVAGAKPMVEPDPEFLEHEGLALIAGRIEELVDGELPLAGALALALLAAWGVLLVTRGRTRRLVSILAAVLAVGLLAATIYGWATLKDDYAAQLADTLGVQSWTAAEAGIAYTGWFWAMLVASLVAVLASAAAVRWSGSWPEMGSRYDAPTGSTTPERPAGEQGEQSSIDLWKSLDEGHDPTA